jgi:tryptophanyl-tRNA synthetase
MSPGVANLFTIIKACGNLDVWNSLMKDYNGGVLKYKDLKDAAADSLVLTLRPFRERREELNRDHDRIKMMMRDSSAVARGYAEQTLNEVKALTGLIRV